jgi:hypothetical protein
LKAEAKQKRNRNETDAKRIKICEKKERGGGKSKAKKFSDMQPLKVSFLQQPVLPWDMSVLQQHVQLLDMPVL